MQTFAGCERTVAAIDLSAIRHNLQQIRTRNSGARILAVVKADAYGHGLRRVAPALSATDGFAVATLDEALAIRRLGLAHRVVLLEGVTTAAELASARQHHVDVVVHHDTQLDILRQADRTGAAVNVWLKFDTGMRRLGFDIDDVPRVREALGAMDCVGQPVRLMSHLACADEPDNEHTRTQIDRFQRTTAALSSERSLANSAGLLAWPDTHYDWVRVGLLLYGVSPIAGQLAVELGFRPAMRFSTRLLAVNRCKAGDTVGYGGRWRCPEALSIGTAAAGYGDGYPRSATHNTPVLVEGRRCYVAGRVSMDMLGIDLRGHPSARVGDEVLLWGDDLPIETVAPAVGCIPWELLCRVTGRVEYRYLD